MSSIKIPSEQWEKLDALNKWEHLLQIGQTPDCSFDVDGENFPCHTVILSNLSTVFATMFNGHFQESKMPFNIAIEDTDADTFRKLLDFIYTGKSNNFVNYSVESLKNLIYVADKYMITLCKQRCLDAFNDKLNSVNKDFDYVSIFEYAYLTENKNLFEKSILAIKRTVLNTPTSRIYDLKPYIFYEYLKVLDGRSDYLKFQMIETYAKVNKPVDLELLKVQNASPKEPKISKKTNKRPAPADDSDMNDSVLHMDFLKRMFALVNFYNFTVEEFLNGPHNSHFISLSKKYELLLQLKIKKGFY